MTTTTKARPEALCKCGAAMRTTGWTSACRPPQALYVCPRCGAKEVVRERPARPERREVKCRM
jgi:predicted RNA-binding Zn-ribbon protein involved in translation (DUF1610 family)